MPTAAYYRAKARECLALSDQARSKEEWERLRATERDNFALAEMIDNDALAFTDEQN